MSSHAAVALEAKNISDRYPNGTAVAIGKFEGVHRGHQRIIEQLREVADEFGLGAVVLTFYNNPLSVLAPERCPQEVMSPQQRKEAITAAGVDDVLMLRFDEQLAKLTPLEFIDLYLVDALDARHVIVGDDFRFGAGAAGNSATLRAYGPSRGFTVDSITEVSDERYGRVSSSRVRQMLAEGNVEAAATLLDAPHRVRGVVVRGDARGRELGFPTANLGPAPDRETIEGLVPADGVYAGYARVDGERVDAAISVGNNPSFTPDADSRVEAFLLDFSRDLYGKPIEIDFVKRLRGTERFTSIEDLVAQMHRDVEVTRTVLAARADDI